MTQSLSTSTVIIYRTSPGRSTHNQRVTAEEGDQRVQGGTGLGSETRDAYLRKSPVQVVALPLLSFLSRLKRRPRTDGGPLT